MKLTEAIAEFDLSMVGTHTQATRKLYTYTTRSLLDYLEDIDLGEITTSELRRWAAGIHDLDLSVHTRHRHIRQAKKFFNWCVEEPLLTTSPAIRLDLPKLPRGEPPKAVTQEGLDRMLKIARTGEVRDYAILRLLAETGCRLDGLIKLEPDDLDLDTCQALVREKGDLTRNVFFGTTTVEVLRAWLVMRPLYQKDGSRRNKNCQRADNKLFLGRRGNLSSSGVYRVLRKLAEASGIGGRFNPHAHRHALARRLLENDADLGTVAQVLGHSDVETTHRFYARWSEKELARRHRQYGGVLDD